VGIEAAALDGSTLLNITLSYNHSEPLLESSGVVLNSSLLKSGLQRFKIQ